MKTSFIWAERRRNKDGSLYKNMDTVKKEAPQLQMLKDNPSVMPVLKSGDLVEATLVEKTPKGVFFEINKIGLGIIYGVEVQNAKEILKKLSIGDTVSAKVVIPENENGWVELSLAEAGAQKTWGEIKELKDKDEPIKVKIINANAGGLICEIMGLQAFLPASQLSAEHYPGGLENNRAKLIEELKKFVGQELSVKIITANPRGNKLIVSEREITHQNAKELLAKYSVGDIVDGIIGGVANFGAFIKFADNPDIEGLVHISELDHRLIENPKDVVKVGDMVKAKIIEIKDGKVSLSLKALQPDPWENVDKKYKVGEVIKGVVHKLNPFGALIKLDNDILGLIHVSEFGGVEEMKKVLAVGDEKDFSIDSIKAEDKRIVLKLTKKS